MTRTVRVLISSPNDVSEERQKARAILEDLQKSYVGELDLVPIFWEDLVLEATKSFQEEIEIKTGISFQKGVDLVLSVDHGIDIAIFIFWARLGSPLGPKITRPDGLNYASGTERELELMFEAYAQSNNKCPKILIYDRESKCGFEELVRNKSASEVDEINRQRMLKDNFVQEKFYDPVTKTNLVAYTNINTPGSFAESLEKHLTQILEEFSNLPEENKRWKGPPYRGLEVFEIKHERIFFGRDKEITKVQEILCEQAERGKAFLLLVGASGSGKSSLVRAGVIPAIKKHVLNKQVSQWRIAIMTPNQSPNDLCYGLAKVLCENDALPELNVDSNSIEELRDSLSLSPKGSYKYRLRETIERIREASSGKVKVKILLLIDQLEELFTNPNIQESDAISFVHAIRILSESGLVWVITTLRDDFYSKMAQPKFQDLMYLKEGLGHYDVPPLGKANLREIIENPAKISGLQFEIHPETKESLKNTILNDAVQNPEALPLVEYTLNELSNNLSEKGFLSYAQYELLGGIEGAIGKRAETIYKKLSDEARLLTPRLFLSLASIDNQGQFTSRSISAKELPKDKGIEEVKNSYLKSRLIITQQSKDKGHNIFKIAHEALFNSWGQYNEWLNNAKIFLEVRHKLEFLIKKVMEENDNSLENYFAENRDVLTECELLRGVSELFSDEAEFIFRSSLCSGLQMLEWSARLESDYPEVRKKVLNEALRSNQTIVRKNVATLLAEDPVVDVLDELLEIAISDQEDAVKREASKTITKLDRPELYQKIIDRLKNPADASGVRTALSYMQMVADQRGKSAEFYKTIEQLNLLSRKKTYWRSTVYRGKEFLFISPFLVIPTILFASVTATLFKSVPSYFNWAVSQADASVLMGAFHGATAGVIWAGLIVLGITTYYSVFGNENRRKSMLNPIGAVITGALVGIFSSVFINIVILGVYQPESLAKMGWIITSGKEFERYNWLFWEEILWTTKFGWCYIITGTGLGIGIALSVNSLKSSDKWLTILENQEKLLSWTDLKNLASSIMLIVFKHITPLLTVLFIAGSFAYMIPTIPNGLEKFEAGRIHLALSLLADGSTQAFGAYFAIVGMSLGLVMIRRGFEVKPMENI